MRVSEGDGDGNGERLATLNCLHSPYSYTQVSASMTTSLYCDRCPLMCCFAMSTRCSGPHGQYEGYA